MFLKVLEFNMEDNKVVVEGGSTVNLNSCNGIDSALQAYGEHLAIECPEIVVVKPIIYVSGEVVTVVDNLETYGIPSVTVEDLGDDTIKPLKKEDYIVKKEMNIEEVTDALEEDIKEAVEKMSSLSGGPKKLYNELKNVISKGESVIDWIKTSLKLGGMACADRMNNGYAKINTKMNDKIATLLEEAKADKATVLKKIGNYIFVAVMQVLKALMGIVKFAADVVISIAKYVGCTVVTITKGIGTVAVDIVQAFKKELIDLYKKPVTA